MVSQIVAKTTKEGIHGIEFVVASKGLPEPIGVDGQKYLVISIDDFSKDVVMAYPARNHLSHG